MTKIDARPEDMTNKIEADTLFERKPKVAHLFRLFAFAFSSAKVISAVYLGLFIFVSLLRPLLAFMWGGYIGAAEAVTFAGGILPAALLVSGYFIINFLADLISGYVMPREEIQRLDLVQANRQQELLHSRMYEKLAKLPPESLEIPVINDRIEQVFKFIGDRWGGMNQAVMMNGYIVIARAVSVATIAASLYLFHPWLCFAVLAAPLPTLWSLTFGQKLRFKFIKENTVLSRKAEYFQNLMLSPAAKEMKTLGLHDFFYGKWKEAADEYTLREKKLIRAQASLNILNYFLLGAASAGGAVFAIVLMASGRISLGALGAAMSLVSVLVSDCKELLAGFATVYMKKNEAAQFFDLMELNTRGDEGADAGPLTTVEAKGLRYRYPLTGRYVLDGVDLKINMGEKVAFVGENGAGKTTLVKLITGTLAPSEGELLINGADASSVNEESRFAGFSAVVQDPARYVTFTAAENVMLGDAPRGADDKAVDEALSFSGFDGYDKGALLGKDIGGAELSGGQWQKLAIARAAYRGKGFMILDEPTGNLDPIAETEIFKKYMELSLDKTVIFVTLRISAASLADRIIVFAGGKIVQDGSHGELMEAGGEYAKLYAEQAKWYDR